MPQSNNNLKQGKNLITKIFQETLDENDWIKYKDELDISAERYVNNLYNRYNIIRVFGMSEPKSMNKLFVDPSILNKLTPWQQITAQELEKRYSKDKRKIKDGRNLSSPDRIINKENRFIVLGQPGAGKTTLLKWFTFLNFKNLTVIQKKRLPIFINLKELGDSGLKLQEFIAKQFENCQFPETKIILQKVLDKGRCQQFSI